MQTFFSAFFSFSCCSLRLGEKNLLAVTYLGIWLKRGYTVWFVCLFNYCVYEAADIMSPHTELRYQ